MANFIPPINLGVFKPSSESLASWLYQVWQYLQENPIASEQELTEQITALLPPEIAAYLEEHPATVQSVNGMIGAVVIAYSDLVLGETLPIYRATSLETTQTDLLEAWDEGCRFAVIDDSNVYVMLRDYDTITLLPIGGGGGGGGIQSINTTIVPDAIGNALVNATNLPLSTSDPTSIYAQIATLTSAISTINGKLNNLFPIGYIYMSVDSTDPGTIFGGTWVPIKDRFLLAAGDTYVVDQTGGYAQVTLEESNLPAISGSMTIRKMSNATTVANPDGAISIADATSGNAYSQLAQSTAAAVLPQKITFSFGQDAPHENMPPYVTVYMWKRTA